MSHQVTQFTFGKSQLGYKLYTSAKMAINAARPASSAATTMTTGCRRPQRIGLRHLVENIRSLDWKCSAAAYAAAAAGFPASILLLQRGVLAPLRISHNKFLGPIFGCASVCVSAIIASETARAVYAIGRAIQRDGHINESALQAGYSSWSCPARSLRWPLYAGSGVALFVCLGGRLRAAAPSSLMHPGVFARYSVPGTRGKANTSKRHKLNVFGRMDGCHTCGVRRTRFIADHMPPRAMAGNCPTFRMYPQCHACAWEQSRQLTMAILQGHRFRPQPHRSLRRYHCWAPVGIAMAAGLGLE